MEQTASGGGEAGAPLTSVASSRPVRGRSCRWRRLLAGGVALALVPVLGGLGGPAMALAPTPRFAPYVHYDVGSGRSAAVGDFTGDGRNDVLVSTQETSADGTVHGHLKLFVQGGDGRLSRTETLAGDLGRMDHAGLAAADFDGDGLTDAALATGQSVDLFIQRAGTLSTGRSIPLAGAQHLEAADIDGDGAPDLVANGSDGIALLRNTGGGSFASPRQVTADRQTEVAAGDVTGDGRPDIVACAVYQVSVRAQASDGTFQPPHSYYSPFPCDGLTLADVNGDGRVDVAVVGGGNRPDSWVGVLRQRPDGTLDPLERNRTDDIPSAIRSGDMNGDGLTDLVVYHQIFGRVTVLAQAPDHTLDPARGYPVAADSGQPGGLAVGDVSGDGRPDVVMADAVNGLMVLLGQPPGPSTTTSSSSLPVTTQVAVAPGTTPPLLAAPQAYKVGSWPKSVVAGDFNGDGRTDVAMTTAAYFDPANDEKLFVFLQGMNGSFDRVVRYDTDSWGSDLMALAAGDLDGDGRTDLVVGMFEGVDVFLQRDGGFADRKYLALPQADRVDLADLDGDGRADLVSTGNGIAVSRSVGDGTFGPPTVLSSAYRTQMAIGDVTGDGRLDLVSASVTPGFVEVYRQLADRSFAQPAQYGTGGDSTGTLALGDVTGDGRLDVVVADKVGDYLALTAVKVLPQLTDGRLGPAVGTDVFEPNPVKVADMDGDGRADVVTILNDGPVGVMRSLGDGRLAPPVKFDLGNPDRFDSTSMVVADVTGDGRPDVAVADFADGLLLLRHLPPAPPTVPRPARYVDRAFRDLLGRPPAATEVATWSPAVATASGRVSLGVALVGSREYRARLVATDAQAFLGHAPDPTASSALVDAMGKGAVDEISAAYFLGSDEFYARIGATPEAYVDALYQRVLGLTPDATSRAALAAVLRTGYSRTSLAVTFLLHPYARGRLVDAAYQRLVGHAPDPAVRTFWVDTIVKGTRSEYVVAWLVSTDEYWARAVAP